eukprot:289525-Prymnesium_polylepis.1
MYRTARGGAYGLSLTTYEDMKHLYYVRSESTEAHSMYLYTSLLIQCHHVTTARARSREPNCEYEAECRRDATHRSSQIGGCYLRHGNSCGFCMTHYFNTSSVTLHPRLPPIASHRRP